MFNHTRTIGLGEQLKPVPAWQEKVVWGKYDCHQVRAARQLATSVLLGATRGRACAGGGRAAGLSVEPGRATDTTRHVTGRDHRCCQGESV